MASDKQNDELTTAITWALDRILRGEYRDGRDGSGKLDSMILDRDFGRVNPVHAEPLPRVEDSGGSSLGNPAYASSRYAREFRQLFPEVVRRARSLPAAPVVAELPEYVKRFLVEAARCLLYGQFLATLFLCRSALGEAAAVTLRKRGHATQAGPSKEEGLRGIFLMAHRHGILDSTQHRQAEEIRSLANRAIHGREGLTEAECMIAFAATVGIVQALCG